jgi:hypothetical protein
MKHLRVIDAAGNKTDYECEHVPRIGELVSMTFGPTKKEVRPRWFRVKDVWYQVDQGPTDNVAILVGEETEFNWPS